MLTEPPAVARLASFVADCPRIEASAALLASRRALADTLGCMLGGARSEAAQSALAAGMALGQGSARVAGSTKCLPAPFAALANATAAHALDYDDYDVPANGHPSAVIFPAVLAAMDGSCRTEASCLLDAHIIGVEVMLRLGEAMNMDHYRRGWHSTLTLGSVAAAAACGRARGFDCSRAAHAISLGASMASGLTNQGGFGAKAAHAGLAAMNGVIAAQLADSGLGASLSTIDGPLSMATAMGEHRPERFHAAMARLGAPFAIVEHGLIAKPYPSCSYTHRIIDAALDLRQRGAVAGGGLRRVEICVPDYYLDLLTFARPQTSAEAMFSAQYAVAATLVDGRFDLNSLTPASLSDTAKAALVERCTVTTRSAPRPDLTLDPEDPDWVRLHFENGDVQVAEIAMPLGSPVRPMSEVALREKFVDCTREVLLVDRSIELFDLAVKFDGDDNISDLSVSGVI